MRILKRNKLSTLLALQWILAGLFFLLSGRTFSQSAVVSSYLNAADPRDEWTEILVVQDNLDMQNWTLRDNNFSQGPSGWNAPITFNVGPFWNHLRAGTVIIIWHRSKDVAGVNHPSDVNKNDGYIEVNAMDPSYFTGGNFQTAPTYGGPTLNIATAGDIIQLRNNSNTHIHALAHKIATGPDFTALPSPKLDLTQDLNSNEAVFVCPGATILDYGTNAPQIGTVYTAMGVAPNVSQGLPNTCTNGVSTNSDFWRLTRQPLWTSPTATATPQTGNTQVLLNWTPLATDAYPNDGLQGYLILRDTSGTFTAPQDGTTYAVNDMIGTSKVIAKIASSQIGTYTDNYPVKCGDSVYYRIYAYRFAVDNVHGSGFDPARGTAYNEISYAEANVVRPAPAAFSITGDPGYCEGSTGEVITLNNSQSGANYYLFMKCGTDSTQVQGPIGGFTGNSIAFTPQTITSPGPCSLGVSAVYPSNPSCVTTMSNTVLVSIFPTPVFNLVKQDPSTCFASDGSIIISGLLPNTAYSLSYTLNGTNITPATITTDGTGSYTLSGLTAGSYTNIVLVLNGCSSLSQAISLNDPSLINTSVLISADNLSICAGTPVIFTASPTNGGSSPAYLWRKNGVIVGTNSPTYTDNTLVNGDAVRCRITSSDACAVPDTALSNIIAVTVTTTAAPSVTIDPDNDTICVNTMVTFTAIPVNGGTNPTYAWTKNSLPVGTNSPTYQDNTLVNGDQVRCEITSNFACASPLNAISPPVSVVVTGTLVPAITISPSQDTICAGTAVIFTASPVNAGATPSYQWKKNGVVVGSNSPTYTDNTLTSADVITCILTSSESCAVPATATSNASSVLVTSVLVPTISISANQTSVCPGTTVQFTSMINNGGNAPSYQWKKNGVVVGSNSPTYTDNSLADGDIITCILTSNDACASPTTANSNSIPISVVSAVVPAITISANPNPVCSETAITLTANPVNQGTAPTYQWKKNGVVVGTNSPSYVLAFPVNGDVMSCFMQSNAGCVSPDTVSSAPVTVQVYALPAIVQLDTVGTTNGLANGQLTVVVSEPGLEFKLDGGTWQSSNFFDNLSAGMHSVSVRNANGCAVSTTFFLKNHSLVTMFLEADTIAACPGEQMELSILSSGFTGVGSFNICMTFDASKARLTGLGNTNPLTPGLTIDSIGPGKIMVRYSGTGPINIPDGELLFSLLFVATTTGSTGLVSEDLLPGVCGVFDNAGHLFQPAFSAGGLKIRQGTDAIIFGNRDVCTGFGISLVTPNDTITNTWIMPDGLSLTGGQLQINTSAEVDSGYYKLITVNTAGCSDRDSIYVMIHPNPVISIAAQDPLCAEGHYVLTPGEGFASYSWQDGSSQSTMPATGEGDFWVKVTDHFGCEGYDTVSLITCPTALFIPTAFSPNGDGNNEVFRAVYTGGEELQDFKIIIFDRWGEMLYQSKTITEGWDGRYKGNFCMSGMYSYIIYFRKPEDKAFSQESPIRGMFTLLR